MRNIKLELENVVRLGCNNTKEHQVPHEITMDVIQALVNGMVEIIMVQPYDPYLWYSEYLRKITSDAYDEPKLCRLKQEYETQMLLLEKLYYLTQRNIRNMQLHIERALEIEADLLVEKQESIVSKEDDALEVQRTASSFQSWCPDCDAIRPLGAESVNRMYRQSLDYPNGNIDAAIENLMQDVTNVVLEHVQTVRDKPLLWMSRYFYEKSYQFKTEENEVNTYIHLLDNLNTKFEEIRTWHKIQDDSTVRCAGRVKLLLTEVEQREDAVLRLTISKFTRFPDDEDACIRAKINYSYHWLPEEDVLDPMQYTPEQEKAFRRAEVRVMCKDEMDLKNGIRFKRETIAAVFLQKHIRKLLYQKKYHRLLIRRRNAAILLQEKYRQRLYDIAMRLPDWCVVGGEVIISKSVARKAAITFQFFRGKDFPPGTYHIEPSVNLENMKQICRSEIKCVGFATDGSLKRFLPRQLSQLVPIKKVDKKNKIEPGLYIKIQPVDDSVIVNHGIIMEVPKDRLGSVKLVYDGIGIEESIPVTKLSERWRKQFELQQLTWYYHDKATGVKTTEEPRIFTKTHERFRAIQKRKLAHTAKLEADYQRRVLVSTIRLQSAWRSKKAREMLAKTMKLREKEQQRAQLVEQAAVKAKKKKGFFKLRW